MQRGQCLQLQLKAKKSPVRNKKGGRGCCCLGNRCAQAQRPRAAAGAYKWLVCLQCWGPMGRVRKEDARRGMGLGVWLSFPREGCYILLSLAVRWLSYCWLKSSGWGVWLVLGTTCLAKTPSPGLQAGGKAKPSSPASSSCCSP